MQQINRRRLVQMSAALAVSTAGCGSSAVKPLQDASNAAADKIETTLKNSSTDELKGFKLALRGYQIVSMVVAGRVVLLPYPGMRILAAVIVVSSLAAKLSVDYIDDELIQRKLEETLSEREQRSIESQQFVTFTTEGGMDMKVYVAPAVYLPN